MKLRPVIGKISHFLLRHPSKTFFPRSRCRLAETCANRLDVLWNVVIWHRFSSSSTSMFLLSRHRSKARSSFQSSSFRLSTATILKSFQRISLLSGTRTSQCVSSGAHTRLLKDVVYIAHRHLGEVERSRLFECLGWKRAVFGRYVAKMLHFNQSDLREALTNGIYLINRQRTGSMKQNVTQKVDNLKTRGQQPQSV